MGSLVDRVILLFFPRQSPLIIFIVLRYVVYKSPKCTIIDACLTSNRFGRMLSDLISGQALVATPRRHLSPVFPSFKARESRHNVMQSEAR